ncbi:MAG: hypothetical protein BMS9Abin29_2195 [Gemmatimonadota bacterium]|nr:MAG: hypothetical protein BMS9Abin29_2195 [Gemmatimonadota bacterium]
MSQAELSIEAEALVTSALFDAWTRNATHVHVEVHEGEMAFRFRIEGALVMGARVPERLAPALFEVLLQMADMRPVDARVPQMGVFEPNDLPGLDLVRVDTIPQAFGGSKILLTLHWHETREEIPLAELGLENDALEALRQAISKRAGLVVVTGPTESGKNTTVYASLLEIDRDARSVATAEIVARSALPGVQQVTEDRDVGLDQEAILRSHLRSDVDVIYVRELISMETAELAVSAVTGHGKLVLTTLHTNDAVDVPVRLMNMGVEPQLLAHALLLVQGQRRLRRLCEDCKTPIDISAETLMDAGLEPSRVTDASCHQAVGCEACGDIGYLDRVLVAESLPMSDAIKGAIREWAPVETLRDLALAGGMRSMRQHALALVCAGQTSLEEVLMHTPAPSVR